MTETNIINKNESFFNSEEQYLVVMASCLGKSIDLSKKEPMLASVINKFPWVTVYEGNEKYQPGSFKVYGDGLKQRKVIVVFGQIYSGKMDYPQDNKNKRLEWFVSALNEIAEIDDLKSISFPSQISRDAGGNWSYYYMAIKEFAQTLHLKTEIPVVLYQNDLVNEDDLAATQISLLNCINLNTATSLESLCFANNLAKVAINNDHLSAKPKKIILNHNKLKQRLTETNDSSHNSLVLEQANEDNQETNNQDSQQTNNGEDTNKDQEKPSVIERDPDEDIDDKIVGDEEEKKGKEEGSEPVRKPFSMRKFGKRTSEPAIVELVGNKATESVEKSGGSGGKRMVIEDIELEAFPESDLNKAWAGNYLVNPVVHESWQGFFQTAGIQKKLAETHLKLADELDRFGSKSNFLPAYDLIFNAFRLCTFDQLKVVILGQDPYPDEKNAMGLAFSVPETAPVAKSLHTIYAELLNDFPDTFVKPKHGCLKKWAEQGVLMLNSALTLRAGESNSHQGYWKNTTDLMIQEISAQSKYPLVFMLWGNDAKGKKKLIDAKRHLVLEAVHPSPMAGRGFIGCKHFSTCNQKLKSIGRNMIDWSL
jgi:uracil-DNA glycosylase